MMIKSAGALGALVAVTIPTVGFTEHSLLPATRTVSADFAAVLNKLKNDLSKALAELEKGLDKKTPKLTHAKAEARVDSWLSFMKNALDATVQALQPGATPGPTDTTTPSATDTTTPSATDTTTPSASDTTTPSPTDTTTPSATDTTTPSATTTTTPTVIPSVTTTTISGASQILKNKTKDDFDDRHLQFQQELHKALTDYKAGIQATPPAVTDAEAVFALLVNSTGKIFMAFMND
jgi:hypothetical protein